MSAQIVVYSQFGSTLEAIFHSKAADLGSGCIPTEWGQLDRYYCRSKSKGQNSVPWFSVRAQLSEAKRYRHNDAVVCLRREKNCTNTYVYIYIYVRVFLSVCSSYPDAKWQVPIHTRVPWDSHHGRAQSCQAQLNSAQPQRPPISCFVLFTLFSSFSSFVIKSQGPRISSSSFCHAAKRKSENRSPTHRASRRFGCMMYKWCLNKYIYTYTPYI